MARFDRFTKLERARPEDQPDREDPSTSGRFGKIEARVVDAPAAPADPFAPPPEEAVALEVAAEDVAIAKAKQERAAHAKAELDAEAQRRAEANMRAEADQDSVGLALARGPDALMKLSSRQRAYLAGGVAAGAAVFALTLSKYFWGIVPLVAIIYLASELVAKNRGSSI